MKIRCKFTLQDYYEYIGTSHLVKDGLVDRVRSSIPYEFRYGYNMKFKKLKNGYYTDYRVSITVDTTIEKIESFLERQKSYNFKLDNFSYKIVKRRFSKGNI